MSAVAPFAAKNCLPFAVVGVDDSPINLDQIDDENIFADEITDEAVEAAASGPTVTFTLSVVLFACQFCPSDRASVPDGRTRQLLARRQHR